MDDVFKDLPKGSAQLARLCARPGTDAVRRAFCGPTAPAIRSLADLQRTLGLAFTAPARTGRNQNGRNGNPAFVLSGHSSSLVARFVSAINPRAIVFTPPTGNPNPSFVAMGFVRGEQLAEIVARDSTTGAMSFFLVKFEQTCNASKSCRPGDLLTPAVEKDWTGFTVYEDEDIKNTIVDCRQCHQPGGPGTPRMLRFQELRNPWTHFFRDNTSGGPSLIADFRAAHGTSEDYGPIPAGQIESSDPALLEDVVRDHGFGAQPNEFRTGTIEDEVRRSAPAQPATNDPPGTSAAWSTLFEASVRGEVIAPPYHDVKVTDPQKLAVKTKAYQEFRAGTLPASALPDLRDVFLAKALVGLSFVPKPGLDGKGLLTQTCTACHNPKLDQTLTRAKFDVVKLSEMSREEKDKAIERVRLPPTHPLHMPPDRFRTLSAEEVARVVDELGK
jgi:hypothetical protein